MGDTPLRKAVNLMHCFRAWARAAQRRQHLSREVVELVSSHLRLQRVRIRFVLWMAACRGLKHGSQRQCCAKPRNALALAQPQESSPCRRRTASHSAPTLSSNAGLSANAQLERCTPRQRTAPTLDWRCAMLKSAQDNCSGALPLVSYSLSIVRSSPALCLYLAHTSLCTDHAHLLTSNGVCAHTCRRASC